MVFVKGTKPYNTVKQMKQGQTIRVLGVPRVSLALVSWRCDNAQDQPDVLNWGLPYEMVIVAVL